MVKFKTIILIKYVNNKVSTVQYQFYAESSESFLASR